MVVNVFINLHVQGELSMDGEGFGVRVDEMFNRVLDESIILLEVVISCCGLPAQKFLLCFLPRLFNLFLREHFEG